MGSLPKIVVVLGPTASGKTNLGIHLAKKCNGEIVSADSRQVYKKMDIATAKAVGTWKKLSHGERAYVVEGVPHYMVDIIDPGTDLSLSDYKRQAIVHIFSILKRGKVPFVVGGTGLYIWSIVDNLKIPNVPPNKKLRRGLEKKPLTKLVAMLQKLDPAAAKTIDLKNGRRVVRALEVSILSGQSFLDQRQKGEPLFDALQVGISHPREELYERINRRIDEEMRGGLVEETKALLKQKYDWILPSMTGIGYKQAAAYLRGESTLEQAISDMKRDTRRYARRQVTWFKRDKRIQWIEGGNGEQAEEMVENFYTPNQPCCKIKTFSYSQSYC